VSSEFPPQPGGIGSHAYNLALQLSKHGYAVTVIADERSFDGEEERAFDASLPFVVQRTAISSPRFLMYFKRIVTIFKLVSATPQVIATGKFSLWSVGFCSLFYKRDYIGIVHGTEVNFKTFLLRSSIHWSLKRFHTLIAVSNYTKDLISDLKVPVVVIPNGIDSNIWKLPTDDKRIELQGHPTLTTVGNVTSRKGQQTVIRHLPKLITVFPDLHYHCIGLKTEAADFEALARQLEVAAHVTFHGRVEDSKLKSILLKTDIFVMLSSETETGDVEGFGIAVLEANALGIPAIGSTGCGIEDAINDGHSGILIDGRNPQAFLEGIQMLLEQQKRFKTGALEWASKHHWEDIVAQYIRVLEANAPDF